MSDALGSKLKVGSTTVTANTSCIFSAITSNAKEMSETTSDPVPYHPMCHPMFTTHDFYSEPKYRDTQKSVIFINFSEQHSGKSFLHQDTAQHIGIRAGKLLRLRPADSALYRLTNKDKAADRHLQRENSIQNNPEMSYRCLGCHSRTRFTFGTGYETALQLDKTNS